MLFEIEDTYNDLQKQVNNLNRNISVEMSNTMAAKTQEEYKQSNMLLKKR